MRISPPNIGPLMTFIMREAPLQMVQVLSPRMSIGRHSGRPSHLITNSMFRAMKVYSPIRFGGSDVPRSLEAFFDQQENRWSPLSAILDAELAAKDKLRGFQSCAHILRAGEGLPEKKV